jgi:flagellar FliL protein
MAAAAEVSEKKGPSLVIQLVVFLVLTLLAVGGGWFTGSMLNGGQAEVEEAHATAGEEGKGGHGEEAPQDLRVFPLVPITTNLADPTELWVRMEVALVFADLPDPEMAERVHQDILAYLRTVKARQIDGPSGFQHLKGDLDERAQLRSDGKVTQVLIRTLLFE